MRYENYYQFVQVKQISGNWVAEFSHPAEIRQAYPYDGDSIEICTSSVLDLKSLRTRKDNLDKRGEICLATERGIIEIERRMNDY